MELLFKIIGCIFMGLLGLGVICLGVFIFTYPIIVIIEAIKSGIKENKARSSKEKKYTFDSDNIDKIEIEINIKYEEEDKD
ncbi:MAG: hypothetical protein II298_03220 [Bacteroidales bacterium]|jgi:hypothetical protein|nr:hypothetical protein [Bacteroidales bacterium]MBQ5873449.1 hypothetical protein [Bacteroidales bacterium]MBQ5892611.1 hypothetical protein [Bacteroidales bacterium]